MALAANVPKLPSTILGSLAPTGIQNESRNGEIHNGWRQYDQQQAPQ